MAKITCKTCKRTWENAEAYMKDGEKCGVACVHNNADPANRQRNIQTVAPLFKSTEVSRKKPEYVVSVETDSVKSKADPSKEQCLYYTVPKVIITKISKK